MRILRRGGAIFAAVLALSLCAADIAPFSGALLNAYAVEETGDGAGDIEGDETDEDQVTQGDQTDADKDLNGDPSASSGNNDQTDSDQDKDDDSITGDQGPSDEDDDLTDTDKDKDDANGGSDSSTSGDNTIGDDPDADGDDNNKDNTDGGSDAGGDDATGTGPDDGTSGGSDASAGGAGDEEIVCICDEACTEDTVNADCPVCSTDWESCARIEIDQINDLSASTVVLLNSQSDDPLASSGDVASMTDEEYEDYIKDQLSQGNDVTLERELVLSTQIVIASGKFQVINLGGYDITLKENYSGSQAILVMGELTLMGSGTLDITNATVYNYPQAIAISGDGAHLTVDGPSIYAPGYKFGITLYGNEPVLDFKSGSVEAGFYAVSGNGSTTHGSTINISGGTLESTDDVAIYHPQRDGSVLNIGDAEIIGNWGGIQMCSGELNIEGDPTIEATGGQDKPEKTDSYGDGSIEDGAAISLINRVGYGGELSLNISGGTLISATSSPIKYYGIKSNKLSADVPAALEAFSITDGEFIAADGFAPVRDYYTEAGSGDPVDEDAKLSTLIASGKVDGISGGNFTGDIGNLDSMLSTGYEIDDATGEIQQAESMTDEEYAKFVINELSNGRSVTLTQNLTVDESIVIPEGASCKLDIGSFDMKLTGGAAIKVQGALELTGSGEISCEGSGMAIRVGEHSGNGLWTDGASLTYDGPSLDAGIGIGVFGENTEVLISSGSIKAESYVIAGNGLSTRTKDSMITIEGGELTSSSAPAIYHPQTGSLDVSGNASISGDWAGIQMCAGSLTVSADADGNAPTISASSTQDAPVKDDGMTDGAIKDGAAISIISRDGYQGNMSVEISAGTFISNTSPVKYYGLSKDPSDPNNSDVILDATIDSQVDSFIISGGDFQAGAGQPAIRDYYQEAPEDQQDAAKDSMLSTKAENGSATVEGGTFSSDISEVFGPIELDGYQQLPDGSWGFAEPEKEDPVPDDPKPEQKPSGGNSSSGSSGGGGGSFATGLSAITTTSAVTSGTWEAQGDGVNWKFKHTDGTYAANKWIKAQWGDASYWYHFGEDALLDGGWFSDTDGNTYYLHPANDGQFGRMYTGWNTIDGRTYFFSVRQSDGLPEGALFRGGTTPDGHTVDENGVWTGR